MKKSRYIIGVALVAGLSLFSCSKSFLDRPALGALTPDLVPTADGVRGLLIGAYADLDGQRGAINGGLNSIGGGGPWEAAPSNWIYGSVGGFDAHKGSTVTDQPPMNAIMTGSFTADNGFFNSKWLAVFDGIVRVNNTLKALSLLNTPGLATGEATAIKAEARFLRGHYYFELRKFFQMVPWIDETTTDAKQPNTDTAALWKHIEDDFKFAYDSLTDVAWNGDAGRSNKWAAASYLAKTYVYEKNYAAAQPLLELICGTSVAGGDAAGKNALGVQYGLVNFADNFDAAKKNNAETIFDVQMSANNGSNQITRANQGDMLNFPYSAPFGCCGFYQPSQDLVNSYKVDANGLPLLTGYNTPSIVNDEGVAASAQFALDITTPVDPRLDWTVGRRGVPYLDWGPHRGAYYIRDQVYAGPYSPKKNVYRHATQDKYYDAHAWAPGTAINVHIIRFADLLLLAAETEVAQGNLPQAVIYVNRVRERAANPAGWVSINDNKLFAKKVTNSDAEFTAATDGSIIFNQYDWVVRADRNETWQVLTVDNAGKPLTYNKYGTPTYKVGLYTSFTGAAQAMQAVMFERKLELAMEGQRFFDLSRWGTLADVSSAYFTFEKTIANDLTQATQTTRKYFPIPQRQIDLSAVAGKPTLTQNTGQ